MSVRVLFEKNEGFCDYCNNKLNGIRNNYEGLVVCKACKLRVFFKGTIEKRQPLSPEELAKRLEKRQDIRRRREESYSKLKKERTDYLKSLSPEKLLDEVGYKIGN
jgi:hypothetical protein